MPDSASTYAITCQSISSVWQVATPSRATHCNPASEIETQSPAAKPQADLPAGDHAACQVATPSRATLCKPASEIETQSPAAKPQADLPAGDHAACQVATPSRATLCKPASEIETPSPPAKPQKDPPAGDHEDNLKKASALPSCLIFFDPFGSFLCISWILLVSFFQKKKQSVWACVGSCGIYESFWFFMFEYVWTVWNRSGMVMHGASMCISLTLFRHPDLRSSNDVAAVGIAYCWFPAVLQPCSIAGIRQEQLEGAWSQHCAGSRNQHHGVSKKSSPSGMSKPERPLAQLLHAFSKASCCFILQGMQAVTFALQSPSVFYRVLMFFFVSIHFHSVPTCSVV